MYGFSEDEQLLVFMDCFGLTRLERPKKLKTDAKIAGSEALGRVTVSRDGAFAASYEDLWDKSVIWSLPELRPAKRFDRFRERGAIVHPEASHYIVEDQGKLRLEPLSKRVLLPLRLDAPAQAKPRGAARAELSLAGGEQRPALALGGEAQLGALVPLRIAHDGTLLYYGGGELICATLKGTKLEPRWRRAVTGPAGARLELYADAARCVLLVHRDHRWTVFVADAAGERSFEIESLGVPAVAGPYLAWQPKPELVLRRKLDDGAQTEHGLGIYAKNRKLDLSNEGVGTLFVGAKGSLLVLAGHRESVLDLIAKVEIPRKLPAKQVEIRQALLRVARPYMEAARLAGACVELGQVELDAKHGRVSVSNRIAGPNSLLGALIGAHSHGVWSKHELPGAWRMGSYGGAGGFGFEAQGVELAQLVAAYSTLAERGIGFATTIDFWARQYGDRWGKPPTDRACLALLAQALVAVVRDGPGAKLDYAALAERGAPSVAEVIAGFAGYPKREQELEYSTSRFAGGLFNALYGVEAAQIWVELFLVADGWEHAGTLYGDLGSHGAIPLLESHPEAAEVYREWFRNNEVTNENLQYNINQLRERLDA